MLITLILRGRPLYLSIIFSLIYCCLTFCFSCIFFCLVFVWSRHFVLSDILLLQTFCFVDIPHLWPFSESKFNLKSDRVNLVAPASPIECLLYLPNTNWDRKGWPGSEIQMYYGYPWYLLSVRHVIFVKFVRNHVVGRFLY